MSVAAPQDRLHYMDQLRALAMLAGVVFHAALAYSPLMSGFFPIADRQNSGWVDVVVWALHLVRMPLFFLVAGFFAASVITRRGGVALARQRVRRILLPFLVAWPIVWWALSASTEWAAMNVQHPSALLVMVREWMQTPSPPQMPPGTAHLWFLYYLLLFGVLHWVARTLDLGRLSRWLMARRPIALMLGLPLLLVPVMATVSAPHPAPEGLLPQFWAIAFYGAFFAFGAMVHASPDWLDRARPLTSWLAVGSVLLYAAYLWRLAANPPSLVNLVASWDVAALEACISIWLTVLCLLLGRSLLNRANGVMRYLAQSAYWTYLLHLPLLFVLQYALMDLAWPWPLKFALSLAATLVVCLLSYQALVRHTPLRRFVG